MFMRLGIILERDEFCGFHAIVYDLEDDSIALVTDSFLSPEQAQQAAFAWIDNQERKQAEGIKAI